jgi:hypothetical protein
MNYLNAFNTYKLQTTEYNSRFIRQQNNTYISQSDSFLGLLSSAISESLSLPLASSAQ